MKIYYVKHAGHYPVGACSVIVAENESQARELLTAALEDEGLETEWKTRFGTEPYTLVEVDTTIPQAIIVLNGDY